MTLNKIEEKISRLVLNRYLDNTLDTLNLNELTMTEYLEKEQINVGLNYRNSLVFLNYLSYADIYQGVISYHEREQIKHFHYDNILEVFRYVDEKQHQTKLLKAVYQYTGYRLNDFNDLLDCFVVKGEKIPIDDELPLSIFLETYNLLLEKAKILKESLWGEISWLF